MSGRGDFGTTAEPENLRSFGLKSGQLSSRAESAIWPPQALAQRLAEDQLLRSLTANEHARQRIIMLWPTPAHRLLVDLR